MQIHGLEYEPVYDNEQHVNVPVTCGVNERRVVINNINLTGLWSIVLEEIKSYSMWSEETRQDFLDLLTNDPADKINYTIGEIILAPKRSPNQYYKFKQKESGDTVYLFIEKLACASTRKKRGSNTKVEKRVTEPKLAEQSADKPKRRRKSTTQEDVKPREEPVKQSVQSKIEEAPVKPKRTRKPKQQIAVESKDQCPVSFECFMLMKISEALAEYAKLAHGSEIEVYKKLNK